MADKGDHVTVYCDFVSDGSGWTMGASAGTIDAIVLRTPDESRLGKYILLVPISNIASQLDLSLDDVRDVYENNIEVRDGFEGLKLPKVSEAYLA